MSTDAVPKKRGPKTDVLEALLKRVDGLEAKLKEKNAEEGSSSDVISTADQLDLGSDELDTPELPEPPTKRLAGDDGSRSPSDAKIAPIATKLTM